MEIPKNILSLIGNRDFVVDEIGKSDSQVLCFEDMVLKIEKENDESINEYNMLKWLCEKLPVPKILCHEKTDDTNYLLMSKLDGEMLCSNYFLTHSCELVKTVAKAMKYLWSVDISNCPYNSCVDNKLRLATFRVDNGLCSMSDCEPNTYDEDGFESPRHLLEWLKLHKPIETPVFSHGDFCLPNVFAKDGEISGFIDLGRSGIADKYQDIALCYRSLKNNFEGKYNGKVFSGFSAEMLFDELEIEPNWELINYYILLDELF